MNATPIEPSADPRNDASIALQVQAAALSQPRFDAATAAFATRLAELLGFERVSVGMVESGFVQVAAISHGTTPEARQDMGQVLAAAMHEAVDQAATVCLPALPGPPRITLAHAELRRRGANDCVCSIPIVNQAQVIGAVTLERHLDQALTAAELARCVAIVNLVGPVLALKRESELSTLTRARRWLNKQWARISTPGELPFKLAVGGITLLLVVMLFVPVPYSISAPARLEGSVQRALVAASDGFIQQTSVRPGDAVKEGQVLAELAQKDLQLEQSKRESELAQHINAYSAAFARADRSLLVVNQAKMAEARAQLELVEKQLERAQIKAPFDGVVISGDLTQSLGAPIQRGAVLMVVAPADQFRLIVEVDERDISDIKNGAQGRVVLAALPGTPFNFRIDRVTPLAATREGRHFFEVEGKLNAPTATLRPGLQGVARVEAASRPLAAMVLGRVFNALRMRLWSWGWIG